MKNKYDLMIKSNQFNKEINDYWPDILSFRIEELKITSKPSPYKLRDSDIKRIDRLFFDYYGNIQYLQIVLWFNNVKYPSRLEAGQILFLPSKFDLENFYKKEKRINNQ